MSYEILVRTWLKILSLKVVSQCLVYRYRKWVWWCQCLCKHVNSAHTFFSVTNSFSASVLLLISSSYLQTGVMKECIMSNHFSPVQLEAVFFPAMIGERMCSMFMCCPWRMCILSGENVRNAFRCQLWVMTQVSYLCFLSSTSSWTLLSSPCRLCLSTESCRSWASRDTM